MSELEHYKSENTQLVRDENGCLYLVEGELTEDDTIEIHQESDAKLKIEPEVVIQPKINPGPSTDDDLFIKWTHDATLFLLTTRFSLFDKFIDPDSKKRRLWEEIAAKLTDEADFKVNGATCDNKFRNLTNTYRKLKERQLTNGIENIKWPYYDMFNNYMMKMAKFKATKAAYTVHKNNAAETIMDDHSQEDDDTIHYIYDKSKRSDLIEVGIDNSREEPYDVYEQGGNSEFGVKWSHEAIIYLLECRFDMKHEFSRPECKKKKLWEEIARRINETFNYFKIDGTACDNKYRNLLNTYRKVKEKKFMTGHVKWPYFDLMDDNITLQYFPTPTITSISTSLHHPTIEDDEEDVQIESNSRKRKRPGGGGDTIKEVLEKKLKLTSSRFDAKQQKRDVRWRDKKALEEKKLAVLSNIATGLQKVMEKEINDSYKDILEEKIRIDHERYSERQQRKELRWQERKVLEKNKIQVLSSISECLQKLTEKIN